MSIQPDPPTYRNAILQGDCVEVLRLIPAASADFIITDPPYITRYRDRGGRIVTNDDNAAWLQPSSDAMFRVLKNNAFALSFYGWPKTDLFVGAWRRSGFRIAGHIIFRKRYASKSAYLKYQHESAYLLVKGNPDLPSAPLPDVMDWVYSGNKFHPTQKSTHILKPLIEAFARPGDLILDPFAGSGSTCVAAQRAGRDYLGIELSPEHCATARTRLAAATTRRAA